MNAVRREAHQVILQRLPAVGRILARCHHNQRLAAEALELAGFGQRGPQLRELVPQATVMASRRPKCSLFAPRIGRQLADSSEVHKASDSNP